MNLIPVRTICYIVIGNIAWVPDECVCLRSGISFSSSYTAHNHHTQNYYSHKKWVQTIRILEKNRTISNDGAI